MHYLADVADTRDLMRHVAGAGELHFLTWFSGHPSGWQPIALDQALGESKVAIVSSLFGEPALISTPDDPALRPDSTAGVFNRLNFKRGAPLIDSNRSAVIYWEPATVVGDTVIQGSIGSQADAPRGVSQDYAKWVTRIASWVQRHGTKVWGLEGSKVRPDLNIRSPYLTSLYALPGALALLENGYTGK